MATRGQCQNSSGRNRPDAVEEGVIVVDTTQNVAALMAAPTIDHYAPASAARRIDAGLSLMPISPAVGVNVHAKGQVSFAAKDAATPAWAPPPRRVPL
jgi:hypothetical protein